MQADENLQIQQNFVATLMAPETNLKMLAVDLALRQLGDMGFTRLTEDRMKEMARSMYEQVRQAALQDTGEIPPQLFEDEKRSRELFLSWYERLLKGVMVLLNDDPEASQALTSLYPSYGSERLVALSRILVTLLVLDQHARRLLLQEIDEGEEGQQVRKLVEVLAPLLPEGSYAQEGHNGASM